MVNSPENKKCSARTNPTISSRMVMHMLYSFCMFVIRVSFPRSRRSAWTQALRQITQTATAKGSLHQAVDSLLDDLFDYLHVNSSYSSIQMALGMITLLVLHCLIIACCQPVQISISLHLRGTTSGKNAMMVTSRGQFFSI